MLSRRAFLAAPLALACPAWAAAPPDPRGGAVALGLKYLKGRQHKDGSFGTGGYKGNVGVTALAGLAMLSAGGRPGAGDFGQPLDDAIDFILSKENVGGRQPGFLHNPPASPHGPMYGHGLAVAFLAAARGATGDKDRSKKMTDALTRSVALSVRAQNKEKGWRYLPESVDADLTVTSVQLFSLRLARDAGIGVARSVLADGAEYVTKCQDARTGGLRYMARGAGVSWARTAAGLLALYSAGVTRGKAAEGALTYLLNNLPGKGARPDLHFHFGHFSAALAARAAGVGAHRKWYGAAGADLLGRQNDDGGWQDVICPHYGTSMALIALQSGNGLLSPTF